MTTQSEELDKPTIDWLIDQIAPNPGNSPLVNFNKQRLRDLIATTSREAENRGKLIQTALFCEENGGTISISRRAMVAAPIDDFTIDSYEEPTTGSTIFTLTQPNQEPSA